MADERAVQVVFVAAALPALDRWLAERGLFRYQMPQEAQREDDLTVYGIGVL